MVVGAAGDSDADILKTSQWLYDHFQMRRVYYSAYAPVCGEVLALPAPKLREHRLYQADWLLRFYGFRYEELPLEGGSLPQDADPKLAWARRHPELFPIEVNRAERETLLRIPGIGPLSADRILALRREHPFKDLEHIKAVGVVVVRALTFLRVGGRYFADRSFDRAGQVARPRPLGTKAPRVAPAAGPDRLRG
jgi:predicted DNA-binding helix-hairpin-helix protein